MQEQELKQEQQIQLEEYSPHFKDLVNYPIKPSIYTFTSLLVITALIVWGIHYWDWFKNFDVISNILSIIPLIPILFIWQNQKRQQWQNQIPNYLNVNFTYQKNEKSDQNTLIIVEYIPLVDIADIRSQAQSVGQSLNNDERLSLAPVLNINKETKTYIDKTESLNNGEPFELHEVSIKLKKPLTEHKKGVVQTHALMTDDVIYWGYPFDKKNILVKRDNSEINLSELERKKTSSCLITIHHRTMKNCRHQTMKSYRQNFQNSPNC